MLVYFFHENEWIYFSEWLSVMYYIQSGKVGLELSLMPEDELNLFFSFFFFKYKSSLSPVGHHVSHFMYLLCEGGSMLQTQVSLAIRKQNFISRNGTKSRSSYHWFLWKSSEHSQTQKSPFRGFSGTLIHHTSGWAKWIEIKHRCTQFKAPQLNVEKLSVVPREAAWRGPSHCSGGAQPLKGFLQNARWIRCSLFTFWFLSVSENRY